VSEKQLTLASGEFERFRKPTRRARFLAEMDKVVPWAAIEKRLRWAIGFRTNRCVTCLRVRWQPVYGPHDLNRGFDTERENLVPDAEGNDEGPIAGKKGGASRSSDKATLMGVERRGGETLRHSEAHGMGSIPAGQG
jgi:hypothetical protein